MASGFFLPTQRKTIRLYALHPSRHWLFPPSAGKAGLFSHVKEIFFSVFTIKNFYIERTQNRSQKQHCPFGICRFVVRFFRIFYPQAAALWRYFSSWRYLFRTVIRLCLSIYEPAQVCTFFDCPSRISKRLEIRLKNTRFLCPRICGRLKEIAG